MSVASPNLQGIASFVTSENGDYIVGLLPPGVYTLTFELSGFERQQKTVALAPTQTLPLNVTIGPATITETVEVVGSFGRRAHADGAGRHQLQAGRDREVADQPRHQRGSLDGPGRSSVGSGGQLFNHGRDDVRIALHGERRHRQREPARPAEQPLHRGRHPGHDRRHRRRIGGVRAVQRRRRQRHHQIGRKSVQRVVPRHAEQRRLAHLRHRQPGAPVHLGLRHLR